jgi:hypothetical protein
MSDKMRWRYADTNPVVAAVDADSVIEIGDLVWQDIDDAKPAAKVSPANDVAGTQAAFAAKFLGVAMQRSRAGDTAPICVATSGVFEFDCAATKAELGLAVGPAAAGDGLANQSVAPVATLTAAIGRVAKRAATPATSLLIEIQSAVMYGGLHA